MATRKAARMKKFLKSIGEERPAQSNLDRLRQRFKTCQRNAGISATREEWLAEVTKLARQYSRGAEPTAQQWTDAAERATVRCDRCGGSGVYQWGACVNGVMTHSGPCFACQGKGRQGQADFKRNWGYWNHVKIA